MRSKLIVLTFVTSLSWVAQCYSKDTAIDSAFVLLDTCSDSVSVSGLWINTLYCPSQNIFLAEGVWVDSEGQGLKLAAIERNTNRIIFDGLEDSGGNSWIFYRLRAKEKLIVIGVTGTEWSSIEYCLVFDTLHARCSVAGRFDLELDHDSLSEADNMFPVDQIGIKHSDTVLTFRFPRKVILRPYDEYQTEDSVVYKLDLRTESLILAFPSK